MSSLQIKAIRGMSDLLPQALSLWQRCEQAIREVTASYGYQEIRFPIVESTNLFKRCIGEVTDIVEKEMYTFADRNGDSLTLRPEGTASCVRAGIQHGLLHNQIQRLWYMGPMFRHERPQKGRYRQFHQWGVETFGVESADSEAELLLLSAALWRQLQVQDCVKLELNSLGTANVREQYRLALREYLEPQRALLDDDSRRRLETNPLRILDSKNPALADVIAGAPQLVDYLDDESQTHFSTLCDLLDIAGIAYTINPRLVRGLDYYTHTVFEWTTDQLGAQNAVCAGGRYDGLVAQLGGKPTPAVGFALGLERLCALVEARSQSQETAACDVYIIREGAQARQHALLLAEKLRRALPRLRIVLHCGEHSFKAQFKKADKSGARWALILGDDEVAQQVISLKALHVTGAAQQRLSETALIERLRSETE